MNGDVLTNCVNCIAIAGVMLFSYKDVYLVNIKWISCPHTSFGVPNHDGSKICYRSVVVPSCVKVHSTCGTLRERFMNRKHRTSSSYLWIEENWKIKEETIYRLVGHSWTINKLVSSFPVLIWCKYFGSSFLCLSLPPVMYLNSQQRYWI